MTVSIALWFPFSFSGEMMTCFFFNDHTLPNGDHR
jgi:hypothetical protein